MKELIEELVDEKKSQLQDGMTVNLNGFGRFHLAVESRTVDMPELFHAGRDIKTVKCRFVSAGHREPRTRRITQVFAKNTEVKRI